MRRFIGKIFSASGPGLVKKKEGSDGSQAGEKAQKGADVLGEETAPEELERVVVLDVDGDLEEEMERSSQREESPLVEGRVSEVEMVDGDLAGINTATELFLEDPFFTFDDEDEEETAVEIVVDRKLRKLKKKTRMQEARMEEQRVALEWKGLSSSLLKEEKSTWKTSNALLNGTGGDAVDGRRGPTREKRREKDRAKQQRRRRRKQHAQQG